MAVFVDAPVHRFGRMVMCHMFADSRAELDAMADKLGVQRRWIQAPGTDREHYDVCKSKRARAIELGAVEITARQVARLLQARRIAATAPECIGPPANRR